MPLQTLQHRIDAYSFKVAYGLDIGFARDSQQDMIGVRLGKNYLLLALADGIGFYNKSKQVSAFAISQLDTLPVDQEMNPFAVPEQEIFIRTKSGLQEDSQGGTTLTTLALFVYQGQLYQRIVHIGNTRVYEMKEGIEQITDDDTFYEFFAKSYFTNPRRINAGVVDLSRGKIVEKIETLNFAILEARAMAYHDAHMIFVRIPQTNKRMFWPCPMDISACLGNVLYFNGDLSLLHVSPATPVCADKFIGTSDGIHDYLDPRTYICEQGVWKPEESVLGSFLRPRIFRRRSPLSDCKTLFSHALKMQRSLGHGDNMACFVVEVTSSS